jgi:hypothetical protein
MSIINSMTWSILEENYIKDGQKKKVYCVISSLEEDLISDYNLEDHIIEQLLTINSIKIKYLPKSKVISSSLNLEILKDLSNWKSVLTGY